MKVSTRIIFLIGCVFFNLSSLRAQEQISKKEQLEVREVCEIYVRQRINVLSDYNASTDSLLAITSRTLSTLLLMSRDYFQKMDYENLEFPFVEVIRVETEDSIGCIMDADPNYKINVKKTDKGWIINGFGNNELGQDDIDEYEIQIAEEFRMLDVKDSIKEILEDFVQGWSEMRQFQESSLLKSTTTAEFYQCLMKRAEYDKLRGHRKGPISLKESEHIKITSDTAWCRLFIKGLGGSRFPLLYRNNAWSVAGVDGRICTDQDVIDAKEDIVLYKELIKFTDRIKVFNDHIDSFFKTGNRSILKGTSTDKLIDQLEIYRRLSGTMDTAFLEVHGMRSANFPEIEYVMFGDSAYYRSFGDTILWVKENGEWLMDDLFMGVKVENNYDKANQTFDDFTSLTSISYSVYNAFDDSQGPVVMQIPDRESVEKPKTKYNHRLDNYPNEISYSAGNEQLIKDLQFQTSKRANQTSFKGVIYVEFDIDNFGKASNFRALDKTGTKEAKLAEEVSSQLGDWVPNKSERPSITNMVVAIQF